MKFPLSFSSHTIEKKFLSHSRRLRKNGRKNREYSWVYLYIHYEEARIRRSIYISGSSRVIGTLFRRRKAIADWLCTIHPVSYMYVCKTRYTFLWHSASSRIRGKNGDAASLCLRYAGVMNSIQQSVQYTGVFSK